MLVESRMVIWLVGTFPESEFPEIDGIDLVHKSETSVESSGDREPETIVFCQEHPGTWSRGMIENWRRRFPLARLCVAYGNWSEGEMRTGQPLPGVERVRLIELPAWLATLTQQPHLPATATLVERIERQSLPHEMSQRLREIRTIIVAATDETRESVKQLAESLGLVVVSDDASKTIDLVLWADGDLHLTSGQDSMRKTRGNFPNAAIVALVHFPREQDCEFAKSHGVNELVGLPVLTMNLAGAIIRALDLN